MQVLLAGFILLIGYSHSFVVPQELPSILGNIIYPNIPPIKKGTDSRLGFGFRLGEHADFQVQIELGPQKFTKPIGNSADGEDSSDTSKRMVEQSDYNKKIKAANSNGRQWLNNWAADKKVQPKPTNMKQQETVVHRPMKNLFTTADQYPIPMLRVIARTLLRHNITFDNDQDLGALPVNPMMGHFHASSEQESNPKSEQIKTDLSDVSLDE